MKPLFQYDIYSLQFTSNLQYPLSKPVDSVQVKDRTNGGGWVIQELGDDSIQLITLSFNRLNLIDRDALYNWIINIVKWAASPFQYTDEKGVVQTVRVISDRFDFPEISHEIYQGSIELEILQ